MFWKILGAVVLVWLAFVLLGAVIKGIFWLVTIAVIGAGGYVLYKAFSSSDDARRR